MQLAQQVLKELMLMLMLKQQSLVILLQNQLQNPTMLLVMP